LIKQIDLEPKIQNIVVTVDFGKGINFEELSEKTKIIYEPEQFPGAILRIMILLFVVFWFLVLERLF